MNSSEHLEGRESVVVKDFTSEELAFARKVEIRLRSNEKIQRTEDKAVMARNLGSMYERVQDKLKERGSSFPLSKLFDEAFGETSGESHYKKRDRLLTLSRDKKVSEAYYTYGSKYLDVVKVLSGHYEFPKHWSEERKYYGAVSKLVEGTSYDYVGGYADRAKIEYHREIDKQLKKIVENILEDKDVDLDWMRYWVTEHPVKVEGSTGFIDKLSSYDYNPSKINSDTLSIHGRVDNRLAPCVRIARVISDYNISKYLPIKVEKQPSQITFEDVMAEVTKLVGDKFLEEYYNAADINEMDDKLNELEEVEGWREGLSTTFFPGIDTPIPFQEHIHIESFIDLELRYNEQMAVWQPVILSRWPDDGSIATAETCMYSTDGDRLITLIGHPSEPFFATQKETTDNYAIFHLFRADLYPEYGEPSKLLILGQKVNCGFYAPQMEFYDFLLAKMDDTPSKFEIKTVNESETEIFERSYSYPISYVKAPTNTLAFWILNNLAYAPVKERIDTLLLEDARKKNRKIRDYANQCEKNYEEGISRL